MTRTGSVGIILGCLLPLVCASCGGLPSSPTATSTERPTSTVPGSPTPPPTREPSPPANTPTPTLPRLREALRFERYGRLVKYSPDGRSLAVVPDLPPIELISARTGDTEATFEVPDGITGMGGSQALAFSPDGGVLAIGGREARVDVWLTQDSSLLASVELSTLFDYDPMDWFATVSDLAFVDQHTLLVSAWEDTGGLVMWDPITGHHTQVFRKPVIDMAALPRTDLVALATQPVGLFAESDAPVVVFDLTARRIRLALFEDDPATRPPGGYPPSAFSVSVSPDGRLLAAVVEFRLRLWDLVENREIPFLTPEGLLFNQVRFSPAGRLAAVTSTRGNCINWIWVTDDAICALSIWDTATWTVLAQVDAPGVTTIDFSPDGTELASGGWDQVIHIWEVP